MTKLKRVRTGCLTCRERHLKCDEAAPDCVNCRKSRRKCKRGLRISFLDITVHNPTNPRCLNACKAVEFCDESRLIASEYRGGLQRYNNADSNHEEPSSSNKSQRQPNTANNTANHMATGCQEPSSAERRSSRTLHTERLAIRNGLMRHSSRRDSIPDFNMLHTQAMKGCTVPTNHTGQRNWPQAQDLSLNGAFYSYELPIHTAASLRNTRRASLICHGSTDSHDWDSEPDASIDEPDTYDRLLTGDLREFIATQDELSYIQAFTDGIAVWMDSLNSSNLFTQLIPWYALKSPALFHSLMACGAKQLSFSKPDQENKATALYNTATAQLVRLLQNPDRNIMDCTTASILLNVYEVISNKPIQRMSHMVGARALIRDCRWNASSTGIPAACFWLSIGIEVLYCLSMNWPVSWDPDDWGIDLYWSQGDNECDSQLQTWVHRSFYILAKVVNFRATSLASLPSDAHRDQTRLSTRLSEWQSLKQLCDNWNDCCPRSMRPVGYLAMNNANEPSVFPKFWLAQTSAMLGRIFYHTAQCILAQVNPIESSGQSSEMKELEQHHARQIMGIVASDRDRSVMVMAAQAVNIAFQSLADREEQEAALAILREVQAINHGTGANGHRQSTMASQWPLAALDAAELSRFSAASLSFGQPWCIATSTLNFIPSTFMNHLDDNELPIENPLQSAYFGHPNQPYKTWYQPVGENDIKRCNF